MKPKQIGAFVVLGGGLGLLWFLAKRGVISVAAQPVNTTPPPAPVTPQTPPPPTGPTPAQIAGAVAGTASTVVGIIAGAGAPAAVAAVPAAVLPAVAAPVAGGVAVGGTTTAGSVAAASSSAAAANAATPAGVATSGGSSGLVGFFTNPITIAVGAALLIGGFIVRARRNETKGDREDFCESLGFYDSATLFGKEVRTGNMDKLHAAMLQVDPVKGEELWIEATQQIGKHDRTRNVAWMHKVLQLFGIEQASTPLGSAGSAIDVYDSPFDDEEMPEFSDDLQMMEL